MTDASPVVNDPDQAELPLGADLAGVELLDAASWLAPGLNGWRGPVAGYPNRMPPWPPAAFRRFARVMRTSVQAEEGWAELCREIDVERFAASPDNIPGFVRVREAHHHKDATAYFSLSLWPKVLPVLEGAQIGPHRLRLRIADWTGTPRQIDLGAGFIAWAHQYVSVSELGVDRTRVYGAQDFSIPA